MYSDMRELSTPRGRSRVGTLGRAKGEERGLGSENREQGAKGRASSEPGKPIPCSMCFKGLLASRRHVEDFRSRSSRELQDIP